MVQMKGGRIDSHSWQKTRMGTYGAHCFTRFVGTKSLKRASSYIGGTSSMMFVEALNSLNVPASLAESPASSSSDRMPKATVEAELPFFKPNYQFRRVATLWVSF